MKKETEFLELRKSLSQLKEGVISLSAMLNKHQKGELYFGINDEGKVCGQTIGKKTKADIIHEIQNNLKPLPVHLTVDEEIEEEKSILHIIAEGDDTPYSAYGRYYIRINDADLIMDSYQLQRYFEEKEGNYLRWEETPTEFDIDVIDEDLLIEYIREANEKGRMEYVYRNASEALNKLGLLSDDGKLNNAGSYLFSSKKPLMIKLANYPTDSRVDFGEIKEFKGNIFECINEAISYIQNHISFKSQLTGIQRVEMPEIPLRAIREIVVNSFAHCSYARTGDCNQYSVYKSYVKIYNPGSIIRNIDPKKFASGEIGSKIRNPIIASVLFKNGYSESFGTGFDRTFSLCAKNRVDFEYQNDDFG
ncbi:MAG: putative DNA binding domain-containing protein, partial [Erysipelotrichaceae bacterium]|nr:putative DNA binding domain-containing protein [Erysipelotrichaceae bacterium]